MDERDALRALRDHLCERLARVSQVLADDRVGIQDALALTRNTAADILMQVETIGSSPMLRGAALARELAPR